jgi:hypothetical protein
LPLIERQKTLFRLALQNNHMYALEVVLFYPGILDVGQTLLASIVINHLLSTFRDENNGIAYVFCSYQSRRKQNPLLFFQACWNKC